MGDNALLGMPLRLQVIIQDGVVFAIHALARTRILLGVGLVLAEFVVHSSQQVLNL